MHSQEKAEDLFIAEKYRTLLSIKTASPISIPILLSETLELRLNSNPQSRR